MNPENNEDSAKNISNLFKELEKFVDLLGQPKIKHGLDTKPTPEILAKIDELAKWAKEFKATADAIVESSQVPKEDFLKILQNSGEKIPPERKALIDQGNQLKQKVLTTMNALNIPVETIVTHLPPSDHKSDYERVKEKKTDKKASIKRSKKFKNLE